MISAFLTSLLVTPTTDACGNSMQHDALPQTPPQQVFVSYQSELAEDAVELAVLRRYTNQIRYCYARELAKEPGIPDMSMETTISIGKTGDTSSAAWTDTELHRAVSDCIEGRLMRMRFPEGERSFTVTIDITQERREG